MKIKAFCTILLLATMGCATVGTVSRAAKISHVGIDPTLNWTAVTTDCTGGTVTGVKYNVYIVSGNGPVPTVPGDATELPCGAVATVDRAQVTPKNAAPLTTTSYQAILADGTYTAVVEAVNAAGQVSAPSNSKTFKVVGRPSAPSSISVGP